MDTSSLMGQILSRDNLNAAYLQVVRKKGAAGVDGMEYTEVISYNKKNLERELQNESRQHSRQQGKTKRREEEI